MNPGHFCQFCHFLHPPCTKEECYCGDDPASVRGEGYNNACFEYWTGKVV